MKRFIGKRLIALEMIFVMLVASLSGCGGKTPTTNSTVSETETGVHNQPEEVYLTKGQWIEGLARTFSLVEYLGKTPYFSDVTEADEIFPFVQAIGDFGGYEVTGVELKPDEAVTREFAVATAVLASNVLEDSGYVVTDDENETIDYDTCIRFAFENGNIESIEASFLEEAITEEEGCLILDWAKYTFLHRPIEEKADVVLAEKVVDLRESVERFSVNENAVIIEQTVDSKLQVGDIFLLPATAETPWAVAKKVVSFATDDNGNQIVTTEQPELAEVFSSIDIEQIAVPDISNIVLCEGVTIESGENSASIEEHMQLVSSGGKKSAGGFSYDSFGNKIIDYNQNGERYECEDIVLGIGIKKGENVSLGPEYSNSRANFNAMLNASPGVDTQKDMEKLKNIVSGMGANYKGDSLKNLEVKKGNMYDKYGISFQGQITLSDLYAIVDIDTDKIFDRISYDVNTLGLTINFLADVDVKVSGKYQGEVMIGYIPFPIGGICAVVLEVFLYVDGNGTVQLGIRTGGNTSFRYEEGEPIKCAIADYSEPWEVLATLDAEMGVGVKPYVSVAGVSVLEAGIKDGLHLNYAVETEEESSQPVDLGDGTKSVTDSKYLVVTGNVTWPIVTTFAKVYIGIAEAETEKQLIGPEGTFENVIEWKFLEERFLLDEWESIIDAKGNKIPGINMRLIHEFINAPEKARITYDNFYIKPGVQRHVNSLLFLKNPNNLNQMQQYIAGTDFSYTEEDVVLGNGKTLSGGAQIMFQAQEKYYRGGGTSFIWYDTEDLLEVKTERNSEDNSGQIGNVGGFSTFLNDYACLKISDFIEQFNLGEKFLENVRAKEVEYQMIKKIGSYGEVTFTLKCNETSGHLYKSLVLDFEKDSISPYRMILIEETMQGGEPILRVDAYTHAYYENDWENQTSTGSITEGENSSEEEPDFEDQIAFNGTDWQSDIIQIDSVVYQFPMMVSELLENGWELTEDSDKTVMPGALSFATVTKGDYKMVINASSVKKVDTLIEEGIVTRLNIEAEGKVPVVLSGNVTFESSKKEIDAVISDAFDFNKSSRTYYNDGQYYNDGPEPCLLYITLTDDREDVKKIHFSYGGNVIIEE